MLPAALEQLVQSLPGGAQVVFDADGTLWRGDVGEDLLRLLAHQGHVPPDTYGRYERLLERDQARAYGFAVEVMAGLEESRLRALAEAFFHQRYRGRVFPLMRQLLARVQQAGAEIWVCSASPVWAVLPGAAALGVPAARVVAVHCEVQQGRLTGVVVPPVTCGPGKVTWLERSLAGRAALAVGNGELDVDMLAWAERALVVATPDGPDNHLVAGARQRGWPVIRP